MAKKEKNPLVGKEVWTLAITNDYADSETICFVYTSFRKALNAVKLEFKNRGRMELWSKAEKELKKNFIFRGQYLFNGDSFFIECSVIA